MGVAAVLLSAFPILSKPISKQLIAKDERSDARAIVLLLQTLGVRSVRRDGLVSFQALARGVIRKLIACSK